MDVREIYAAYHSDLEQVEQTLHQSVRSDNPQLSESATQLLEAGGKRIRPLFALIGSRLGEGDRTQVYSLAAAIELVHMATLVHDDVIDDAALRRGRPTVRAQFGNLPAMFTGDFLFARAIHLLSTIPIAKVHFEMSSAMVRMCEGEIEQIRDFYNVEQSLRNYLRRVERKTALLISVSCSLGALVTKAPPDTVNALRRFGYYTGMAYQITDDILDYVGDEAVVGKPVGGDLRQGNLSLPALHAASQEPYAGELRELIRSGMDSAAVARAIDLVRASDAVEYARELAATYMTKALSVIGQLAPGTIRNELTAMSEFVNQRMF